MNGLGVLGAGSYGTAMAIQLARRGTATRLWGRNEAELATMQQARVNARYLPGCHFPVSLTATSDLEATVQGASHLMIVVPSHALRETLERIAPLLGPEQGLACACKGLEPGTGRLVHEVVAHVLGEARPLAVISGPTFAKEMGLGLPTAVTVASLNEAFADLIAQALHGDGFRAYTSDDVVGVEIGGSAKNVMAIAVGIADGMSLGANTRAALITRGLAETMRLAQGKTVAQAIEEIQQVVEGVKAAPEVLRLARSLGVEMPITEQVVRLIAGEITPVQAVKNLATRPSKAETD